MWYNFMVAHIRNSKYIWILASGLAAILTMVSCQPAFVDAPPVIPASYYNCLQAQPFDLISAYYSHYNDRAQAEFAYNGKVFVFKGIELTDHQVERLQNEPVIWLDLIKCNVANIADARKFKVGDVVDVIGVDQGIENDVPEGLVFNDCYIIPSGQLQLPADGSGPIVAGY